VAKTCFAVVIGDPVSQSLSPKIFGFLSEKLKKKMEYKTCKVSKKELSQKFKKIKNHPDFIGCNITIPHKENIKKNLNQLSKEVKTLGAVNVVSFKRKKTIGHNTDIIGIRQTIKEQKIQIRGNNIVVFGAGGAAKAVAYVLGEKKAKQVWIVNRTRKNGKNLCNIFNKFFKKTKFISCNDISEISKVKVLLYVNTTPLGMKGFPKKSLLPANVTHGAWTFDLIYKPENTPFLKDAKRKKLKSIGGMDMFVWQAIGTWEIWFGNLKGKTQIKKQLKSFLTQ